MDAEGAALLKRLEDILARFEEIRIVVVGDLILDEYLVGDALRVSPEAPVPVVALQTESIALGGAGNVARNLVALGGECRLCAVIGEDDAGRRIADLLNELKLDGRGLVVDSDRPTTHKTRIVARSQQLLRYDRESVAALSPQVAQRLVAAARAELGGVQGAILEDYGKGTFSSATARSILESCQQASIPVAVDPKSGLSSYRGASLIKPNLAEAEALTGVVLSASGSEARIMPPALEPSAIPAAQPSPPPIQKLMDALMARVPGADIALTRGGGGMLVCESGGEPRDVPTSSREVYDVQGAGDTTIAALWLARLAGASLFEAALIANAAAGVVVGKIGTAAATREEVRERLPVTIAAGLGTR